MVSRYFKYSILLKKEPDGFHVATYAPHYSYSKVVTDVDEKVTDFKNAPNDKLTQLGDIANDVFHARDLAGRAPHPTSNVSYVGSMANPRDGFVYEDAAGYYRLLTNSARFTAESERGALLDVENKPFPLSRTAPQCFAEGTRIATASGERPVETLRAGDIVVTATGARRPIRWVGHRELHGADASAWPVRVAANAFGGGLPVRELFLSPGHPVLVDAGADNEGGHLVPIMCLVNGTTIQRVEVERVTYWHVELDAHDMLLAEGLPAESYLELGDRAFFTQAARTALANPDLVPAGHGLRCRPVAVDGPVVERERQRLDATFADCLAAAAAWPAADADTGF